MNYWLVIVRERTFLNIVEHGFYGCSDPQCGLLTTRVKRGDRLLVFVSGFGCRSYCKSFTAVLEVVGDWVRAGGRFGDWSMVVEVRPIALGRVELGSVANKLSFVKGRRSITEALHSVDPANPRAMPLPEHDAQLIMMKLGQGEVARAVEVKPSITGIEDLMNALAEIGQLLGYYPVRNYDTGTHVLTQVWWDSEDEYREGLAPLATFETTQNLEQALAKLKHARDKWRGVQTYLVILRNEDQKALDKALRGSFHELKNKIKTISREAIEQLHKDITKHRDIIKELTGLRQT